MNITIPIRKNGKIYNNLSVNLSVTTVINNNNIVVDASMRLVPYSDEYDILESDAKIVNVQDVENSNDVDVIQCVTDIETAIKNYINAKKL